MQLAITSAKLVGNPGPTGWVQVHDFIPEDEEKIRLRGHLYGVIFVRLNALDTNSISLGREILTRLHEEYFGRLEISAFESLKSAIGKVTGEFSKTLGVQTVEIAAAAYVGEVLYTAVEGQTQAVLFRNNILANILVGKDEKVASASGYPMEKDIFLLGTKSFFDIFNEQAIKSSLSGEDITKVGEAFASSIHSANNSNEIGAVVISFKSKDVVNLPQVNQETPEVEKEKPVLNKFSFLKTKIFGITSKLLTNLPARRIYVKKEEESSQETRSKKTTFSVGAVLLFLLVVSIIFGIKQNRTRTEKLRYQARLEEAEHSLEESVQLFSLNPDRARELFTQSSSLVLEMTEEGIKDTRLTELENKLKENKGKILAEYTPQAQPYSDLSLLSSGFSASKMSASTTKVLFLDTDKKRAASLDIETKKAKVEAGPDQLEGASAIVSYGDDVYSLASDGIYEIDQKSTKVIEKEWEDGSLIYAYAGNIYVLNKQKSEIYRYAGIASGFSSQSSWLAPGIEINLSDVVNWTIDGSIWVAFPGGRITKITQGVPKNIDLAGVSPTLASIKAIYSNEELNGVYVLDNTGSRILVLDKEGKYIASYKSEKLAAAEGLAVSESKKMAIFLVEGSKLYSLELEHLK